MVSIVVCRDEVLVVKLKNVFEIVCLKACERTNAGGIEVLLGIAEAEVLSKVKTVSRSENKIPPNLLLLFLKGS